MIMMINLVYINCKYLRLMSSIVKLEEQTEVHAICFSMAG